MTLIENLKAAKELLSNPDNWGKGTFVALKEKRVNGRAPVGLRETSYLFKGLLKGEIPKDSCRWCLTGALQFVAGLSHKTYFNNPAVRFLQAAARITVNVEYATYLVDFNDALNTTHADVMALFDKAIEIAEKAAE